MSKQRRVTCTVCGASLGANGLGRHLKMHRENPNSPRLAKWGNSQLQPIPEPVPNHARSQEEGQPIPVYSVAPVDPLAYAVAVGSLKEWARHFAFEHDYPARLFTRRLAELFYEETRR